MTSVESAVPVKTPEPDQYWEHVKSKDRVYFIGRNPEGVMVWQCEGDTVEVGDLDWSDWQHIPGCSGWQWEPVPADVFPQYWTSTSDKYAYLLRYNEQRCVLIDKLGRRLTDSPWYASDTNGRTQLTRDDALALLDKPAVGCADIQNGPIVISNKQANEIQAILDKPSETWPKYYVCDTWPVSAYVRRYSDGSVTAIGKDGSESHWDVETKFPDVLPDGWREVTEAEAIARVVNPTEPDSDPPPFAKPFMSPRSGMGIKKDFNPIMDCPQCGEFRGHGHECEPVESPDDWVEITDPKHVLRRDVDQFYNSCGKWELVEGYCGAELRLIKSGKARCRRKDLPAVPAPIEETFPQWYILKESEVHQALTPWAIKRTGEETSIRYAYDGGDKLLASNETWYGATDVWKQCHSAEAFQRLGILGEAYLPAVPSDMRRVPLKLWVTYRLADEGGDWPVRATQADATCENWKEIQFDSDGMFIEVEGGE